MYYSNEPEAPSRRPRRPWVPWAVLGLAVALALVWFLGPEPIRGGVVAGTLFLLIPLLIDDWVAWFRWALVGVGVGIGMLWAVGGAVMRSCIAVGAVGLVLAQVFLKQERGPREQPLRLKDLPRVILNLLLWIFRLGR